MSTAANDSKQSFESARAIWTIGPFLRARWQSTVQSGPNTDFFGTGVATWTTDRVALYFSE